MEPCWVGLTERGHIYILVAGVGCDSYGLSVTDVTASSAVLHWNMDFPSTSGNKSRMKSDHEVHNLLQWSLLSACGIDIQSDSVVMPACYTTGPLCWSAPLYKGGWKLCN